MKPNPPRPTARKAKAPKPQVMLCSKSMILVVRDKPLQCWGDSPIYHCAVIPCASIGEARQRVRFERMGWEEKVEVVAKSIHFTAPGEYAPWTEINHLVRTRYRERARAALLALGHRPTGGRK